MINEYHLAESSWPSVPEWAELAGERAGSVHLNSLCHWALRSAWSAEQDSYRPAQRSPASLRPTLKTLRPWWTNSSIPGTLQVSRLKKERKKKTVFLGCIWWRFVVRADGEQGGAKRHTWCQVSLGCVDSRSTPRASCAAMNTIEYR